MTGWTLVQNRTLASLIESAQAQARHSDRLFIDTSDALLRLCMSKQEQRINKCGCSGVAAAMKLRQGIKQNMHSYPVWVQGKKTENEAENRIDDVDGICMRQEPRTCWSRQMLVGLESDNRTVWDGNWIHKVLYTTTVFRKSGELYQIVLSRVKEGLISVKGAVSTQSMRGERADGAVCTVSIEDCRCTGKHERNEVERIMLRWKFNVFYRTQVQHIYTIDYAAKLYCNSIIYCVICNMKKIEQRKI